MGPCPRADPVGLSRPVTSAPRRRSHTRRGRVTASLLAASRGGKRARHGLRCWGAGDPEVLDFAEAGRPGGYALELLMGSLCLSRELRNSLLCFPVECHHSLVNEKLGNFPRQESRREWVAKAQRAEVAIHLHWSPSH